MRGERGREGGRKRETAYTMYSTKEFFFTGWPCLVGALWRECLLHWAASLSRVWDSPKEPTQWGSLERLGTTLAFFLFPGLYGNNCPSLC